MLNTIRSDAKIVNQKHLPSRKQNKTSFQKQYQFKKKGISLSHSLIFRTKIQPQHTTTHTSTFLMTANFCSTCSKLGNTPYSCSNCRSFICIPCIIAFILSATYPAKIIRNCPFCNITLTTQLTKSLYLANLEYANLGINKAHRPSTAQRKESNNNPYT